MAKFSAGLAVLAMAIVFPAVAQERLQADGVSPIVAHGGEDINRMTAGYLTSPVEPAFDAWQEHPWGKQIPFDAFCEEIRPCRAGSVLYTACPKGEVYRKMSVEPFNKTQPEQGNPWKNETPKELMPP
jgi:hypothetical protein